MSDLVPLQKQLVVPPKKRRPWAMVVLLTGSCALSFMIGALCVVVDNWSERVLAHQHIGERELALAHCLEAEEQQALADECAPTLIETTVLRSLVHEWAASDSDPLVSSARLVPWMERGEISGLKVYGVMPGSPLAALGLQSGDTIYSMQGVELLGGQSLLDFIRGTERSQFDYFTIEMSRAGCKMTMILTLV